MRRATVFKKNSTYIGRMRILSWKRVTQTENAGRRYATELSEFAAGVLVGKGTVIFQFPVNMSKVKKKETRIRRNREVVLQDEVEGYSEQVESMTLHLMNFQITVSGLVNAMNSNRLELLQDYYRWLTCLENVVLYVDGFHYFISHHFPIYSSNVDRYGYSNIVQVWTTLGALGHGGKIIPNSVRSCNAEFGIVRVDGIFEIQISIKSIRYLFPDFEHLLVDAIGHVLRFPVSHTYYFQNCFVENVVATIDIVVGIQEVVGNIIQAHCVAQRCTIKSDFTLAPQHEATQHEATQHDDTQH